MSCLHALPSVDDGALEEEQQAWSDEAETKAQQSADEVAGGLMAGLNYDGTKMAMQEERIEALLDELQSAA